MAPGKKQKHNISFKPTISYVHPSLRSSTSQPSSLTPTQDDSASVSDRIQYLRRVQRPSPASVAEVEQDLSTLKIRTPPRGHVPGPPPPRSWISGELSGSGSAQSRKSVILRPNRPDYLPGVEVPGERSLTHLLLKDMAQNIHWHLVYDHVYLSALPVNLKGVLMSYVACYGPPDGVSWSEVKTIFASPELASLPDATGAEELDRLDLACSVGRAISCNDLTRLWLIRSKGNIKQSTASDATQQQTLSPPESWEDPFDLWQTKPTQTSQSHLRFPAVTKLSLACPGSEASWSYLITFSRHLSRLTHLSLGGWPRALVPFDDAITSNCPDLKRVVAREHRDIACDVLRVISRNIPSLTYLSLADCHSWLRDLKDDGLNVNQVRARASRLPRADLANAFDETPQSSSQASKAAASLIWSYAWRHLRILDLSQTRLPPKDMDSQTLRYLYESRRWRSVEDSPEDSFAQTAPLRNLAPMRNRELEAYTISGSSSTVNAIEERQIRRQWHNNELVALNLGHHINHERHKSGLKIVDIEYGWGVEELKEAGYSREDIWKITGHDGG